ncbi:hypothetical protein, partial [Bacillus thuringiensis]|uniref:hypothetical protein n=1 Tax=Bacillus thuringiensis TaxID=1428 RepID=UPI0011A536E2
MEFEEKTRESFELSYVDSFCKEVDLKKEVRFGIKGLGFFEEDVVMVGMDVVLRKDREDERLEGGTFLVRIS